MLDGNRGHPGEQHWVLVRHDQAVVPSRILSILPPSRASVVNGSYNGCRCGLASSAVKVAMPGRVR
jgi:hypothetical protein